MKLKVNGQDREVAEVRTLRELLLALEINPEGPGLALALNGQVVPRRDYAATPVEDGDRIEVVRAVQGG
jgi:sulfur carrier protein